MQARSGGGSAGWVRLLRSSRNVTARAVSLGLRRVAFGGEGTVSADEWKKDVEAGKAAGAGAVDAAAPADVPVPKARSADDEELVRVVALRAQRAHYCSLVDYRACRVAARGDGTV